MAGIVGVMGSDESAQVKSALEKLSHRGGNGPVVYEMDRTTQGQVWPEGYQTHSGAFTRHGVMLDGAIYNWQDVCCGASSVHNAIENLYQEHGPGFVSELDGPFALVMAGENGLFAARDPLGIAPLYQGVYRGEPCFASEVKALLGWASDIREFPPGSYYEHGEGTTRYFKLRTADPLRLTSEEASARLLTSLDQAVEKHLALSGGAGSWLSGGLDSSSIAALARSQASELHTFSVGLKGAPDPEYARLVAAFLDADHHEIEMTLDEILAILPEVIYHMESFDAWLIRSSVMNFMVGRLASDYVPTVFSGEGGDEMLAGYEYLKSLEQTEIADELVDITHRLHNTALQRVDRCSSAHGLTVCTPFLDRDVVETAMRIPADYKLRRNGSIVEKWILRRAMSGLLPEEVVERTKAKFWEGSGVEDMLEAHANAAIPDAEFEAERMLPDGSSLISKEELMYYRIFREHFGDLSDLSFVGRTKGAE